MIDENKEQLRNLFRKYTVVDVQPAISDTLPDDITTLQVWTSRNPSGRCSALGGFNALLLCSSSSSSWRCCCAWQEFCLSP